MKQLVMGIMAHVDAGKTTLSEAMLYQTGAIKTLGRVDHRDAHLDTHALERERGITIFSKQARMETGGMNITLMDTPGHADFAAELERVLPVLDYAILVVSGTDGVQAHTETIWRLLARYEIPTFLFVNKMDLAGADKAQVLEQLRKELSENCMDFSGDTDLSEELAMCDELLLEQYLECGMVTDADISRLILKRRLFPCWFGSALKLDGVTEFLSGLERYTEARIYPEPFGARVYKIARDAQGNRLTYLKVTGGTLRVRSAVAYVDRFGEEREEKVSQLRLYSGAKFETVETVSAGEVCAVLGLSGTWPGQGLGCCDDAGAPLMQPVLSYQVSFPESVNPHEMLPKLRELEEEDPMLHIVWDAALRQIHAQLMGEVQIEILKRLIADRFGVDAQVDSGRIMYRETIAGTVEGVGHFEPLRHYAEVHLLLEPMDRGSGLVFDTVCSEDILDRNWQRLILTHLEEKQHLGVLTGSPVTDMKLTLIAGRAHTKHTEGGDFRQATYRAVRQGLMQAESILLEPIYRFRLTLPADQLGRAINDIRGMSGTFQIPDEYGESVTLTGTAPVSLMRSYQKEVAAYTRGRGKLSVVMAGYAPCHEAEKVIAELAYDPERDVENTPDSVFCAHGAGFTVKWNQVTEYMHLDSGLEDGKMETEALQPRLYPRNLDIDDKELEAIMEREFGAIKRPQYRSAKQEMQLERMKGEVPEPRKEYIIVDGYNMIFAWEDLKPLAETELDAARMMLTDMLAEYCAFRGCELVLVFDAYRVKGNRGSRFDRHNVHVVYTGENETGDMYIEKLANSIGRNYRVKVATSDALIQLSALRSGILRVSAREFEGEVKAVLAQIREITEKTLPKEKLHL